MVRSLLRRAAVAAALTTAAGLLAGPALPAQAAEQAPSATAGERVGARLAGRIHTTLSIRTAYRPTKDGAVDVVGGVLRARRVPLRHRPVMLLSRTADDAEWTLEAVHRTGRRGVVRFRVDPDADTGYRLAFAGTRLLMPARSAVVRVPVRPDVTIAADPTTINQGESTTVSGTVMLSGAALEGARIRLLAVVAGDRGRPQVVDRGLTDAAGEVSFTAMPDETTRYRLAVVPSDTAAGALSGVARVEVLIPASAG